MCFLILRNGKEIGRRAGLWGREGRERQGEGEGQPRGGRGGRGKWRTKKRRREGRKQKKEEEELEEVKYSKSLLKVCYFSNQIP